VMKHMDGTHDETDAQTHDGIMMKPRIGFMLRWRDGAGGGGGALRLASERQFRNERPPRLERQLERQLES
jgi:hypothetical protein